MTEQPADMSEEKARVASVATRKFDLLDMANADPKCRKIPAALKLLQAYLRFVTDFDEPVYRSIIDLRVDTALGTEAIVATRRKLVALGYLLPEGKTERGVQRVKLAFTRENDVLDHINISRESLRRMEADRKEKQRLSRRSSRPVISANELTSPPVISATENNVISTTERPDVPVTSAIVLTNHAWASDDRTDVISTAERKYVEHSVEKRGSEGERELSYTREEGPSPDLVDALVDEQGDPGPAVVGYWRRLHAEGRFSADVVTSYWLSVRKPAPPDPVLAGLQRAASFGGGR
jgi:hypothetical protein